MINFTVGPVTASETVCSIGGEQVPYFRTAEFSEMIIETEVLVKKYAKAEEDSRVVFITGSGTASMEATVMNTLTSDDKVLIVNGGSFGQRFVDICQVHDIPFVEIKLDAGQLVDEKILKSYDSTGCTSLIINAHETSTGVYYDMKLISDYCKEKQLFLIVDVISTFMVDDFNMKELGVDVMIAASQKALACPPGISFVVLSNKAINRAHNQKCKCLYWDFKTGLKDGERGQTPFTPAVGILRQINTRLKEIDENGGLVSEQLRIAELASDFRNKIINLPFRIVSNSMSNAVTPLCPTTASAYDIVLILKDEYGIWVCPNGGELKDKLLRVGHIGALTKDDNTILINAFKDMKKRGLI